MNHPLRVVKVGGSLYDMPDLAARCAAGSLGRSDSDLLFPGGGELADAIRAFDRVHRLGEEAAHWLALQALSVNASMLARLFPEMPLLLCPPQAADPPGCFILDPLPFFKDDEQHAGRFPQLWQVTSDSLAVRVAVRAGAAELVLLKSVPWNAEDGWASAADTGVVDGFFSEALRQAPCLAVRVVNLRDDGAVR